jgi:ribose/xylose/arabinose/galactoside ABC-type transport system permease subunit
MAPARLTLLRYVDRVGIFLAFTVIVVVSSLVSPFFLTTTNLLNILRQISIIGILSVGMTFVIISGGIDLSVGSVIAISGVFVAVAQNAGVLPGIAVGLLMGALVGFVNGVGITAGRIQPFIMTLGTMAMARGVAYMYTGGLPIRDISSSFLALGNDFLFGVPMPIYYLLVVLATAHVVLTYTPYGRYVYGIGSNQEAARLSGVRVDAVKTWVYVMSGVLAGLGGIIYTAQLGIGTPIAGQGYELDAIAAVVVGGASVTGGEGTVFGTFVGAAIIGILSNIMNLTGVNPFVQQFLKGLIIIGAVLLKRNRS